MTIEKANPIDQRINVAMQFMDGEKRIDYKSAVGYLKKIKRQPGITPDQIRVTNELIQRCQNFKSAGPAPTLAQLMDSAGELD